jgi:hypothetical protein
LKSRFDTAIEAAFSLPDQHTTPHQVACLRLAEQLVMQVHVVVIGFVRDHQSAECQASVHLFSDKKLANSPCCACAAKDRVANVSQAPHILRRITP